MINQSHYHISNQQSTYCYHSTISNQHEAINQSVVLPAQALNSAVPSNRVVRCDASEAHGPESAEQLRAPVAIGARATPPENDCVCVCVFN